MSKRILIVDDSPYVADSFARLISVCGYETKAVYSGREALEQIAAFAPEMVLMDICMPDLDGFAAAKRIRLDPRGGQIILVAVTCLAQKRDKELAYASGFDMHIAKPVGLTTLYRLLALVHGGAAADRQGKPVGREAGSPAA